MENLKKKYTLLSYAMFFYIGIFFMMPSALKLEIAAFYAKDTSDIQFMFTFFTAGSFVALIINKYLLEKIESRKLLMLCYFLSCIGIIIIATSQSVYSLGLALGILGISSGMIMSVSNYIIISIYDAGRTKALNILNFCYSVGSLLSPIIILIFLKINFTWKMIYLLMIIFLVAYSIYTMKISKYKIEQNYEKKVEKTRKKFNFYIIATGIMMFLYVCSEITMTYWIEEFSLKKTDINWLPKFSLALFWIFIALGRFLIGIVKIRIKNDILIINSAIVALLFSGIGYFVSGLIFFVCLALAGLGYSVLYATILSYGTQLEEKASTGVMTFYIVCGALGAIMASPISGTIKKLTNVETVYLSAILMMGLLISIILVLNMLKKQKGFRE